MRNWDTRDESGTDKGCEWEKDWEDVQLVCRQRGLPCELVRFPSDEHSYTSNAEAHDLLSAVDRPFAGVLGLCIRAVVALMGGGSDSESGRMV